MERDRIAQIAEKRPNVKYNDFSIDVRDIQYGIVFLFASWSSSLVQLRSIMESLGNSHSVPVYIYDIDHPDFWDYKIKNNLTSDGWGETYWVKNGKVIACLKKYSSNNINEILTNNNAVLSEK